MRPNDPDTTPCIQAPELLSRPERARDALATAVLWGVYGYLWLPLASLLAWAAGIEFAYDAMVRAGGIEALKSSIGAYAVLIAAIFIVVTAWSLSNRLRFTKRNRRRAPASAADETLAQDFGVTLDTLAELRCARSLRVSIDETGYPRVEQAASTGAPERDDAFSAPGRPVPAPSRRRA